MKINGLVVLALLFAPIVLHAQDTIIFRNGEEVRVNVTEVSDTIIKYKLWTNQTGPTYIKNVSDIFMVKYKGGFKEVYGAIQSSNVTNYKSNESKNDNNSASVDVSGLSGRMERSDNKLLLDGCEIDDIRMKALLGDEQFGQYKRAASMRSFGAYFLGLGVGELVSAIILLPVGVAVNSYYCWVYGWISFAFGIVELPIGIVSYAVNTGRLNRIADGYNQKHYSENMSLEFAPTVVSSFGPTGKNHVSPGFGVNLNF